MKLIVKIILMALALQVTSCDKENIIVEKEVFIDSVSVPDTVFSGRSFEIEFDICLSGCQSYSNFLVEEIENNLYCKVFIKDESIGNPEILCTTEVRCGSIKEVIMVKAYGEKSVIFNDSILIKKIFITQ